MGFVFFLYRRWNLDYRYENEVYSSSFYLIDRFRAFGDEMNNLYIVFS